MRQQTQWQRLDEDLIVYPEKVQSRILRDDNSTPPRPFDDEVVRHCHSIVSPLARDLATLCPDPGYKGLSLDTQRVDLEGAEAEFEAAQGVIH